jgi:hypothetical protein
MLLKFNKNLEACLKKNNKKVKVLSKLKIMVEVIQFHLLIKKGN